MVQSVIEPTTGKTTTIGLNVSGALGVNIAMRVDVVPIAWLVDGVIFVGLVLFLSQLLASGVLAITDGVPKDEVNE